MPDQPDAWVVRLCQIPEASGGPIGPAAFREADPVLQDRAEAEALIRHHLLEEPGLVQEWQQYSWDKRWSPSPYLDRSEVGFYDQGSEDVEHYDNLIDACAAFIYREAAWVLEKSRT